MIVSQLIRKWSVWTLPIVLISSGFLAANVLTSPTALAQENMNHGQLKTSSLPKLPAGITSFGGALCNDHIYVYGGYLGDAHDYYKQGQNPTLYALSTKNPEEWNVIDTSIGRQGLAMVAYDNKLFRLGGFEARNDEGDEQDLHSVADFDVFDPAVGEWTALNPMPEARSSFDAAVVGSTLYVVGGWKLAGEGNTKWSETALSIDLSDSKAEWQQLPKPPFQRRALSVSFHGDKLFAIGGMQQNGGPTRSVSIYDLESKTWSDGPELPGEKGMEGFGNSSFNVGGRLLVSTYSGHVFQLNDDQQAWNKLGTLDKGRFFHRLLPLDSDQFVLVGGAKMESGKVLTVDAVTIEMP